MSSIYFGEEHQQFRETVGAFLSKETDPPAWEREKRIPREVWRKMGELGFLGISEPEAYGGTGADFFYSAVFLEEIGRLAIGGFSAAVGVQQFVATQHIGKFGSEYLKERYVTPSIRGEKVGALAVSEPDAGSDVAHLRARAVRDGDDFVLNGAKTFITNGVYGDFVTVAARTGDPGSNGISLFVVDQGTPGFSARCLNKMGWHFSDTGELSFEDARIPAVNLIGLENKGFYYIMACFQLERLVAALTSVGTADTCLELTLDYIRKREAFGKPVSRFQAVRHRLADLATELESVRQFNYHACWLYDRGIPAVKECTMAKLKATELGKEIADTCLQCFGGYGYMEEYPIARIYRDARVATIAGGTSEIMREIIAKVVVDRVTYSAPSGTDSEKTVSPGTKMDAARSSSRSSKESVSGPLNGVRVLDLTRLYPGPLGAMLLAQMGAEVIKVEDVNRPDPMASYPPMIGRVSAGYRAVNQGKKSLVLDLAKSRGKSVFLDLVRSADLVIEGFRPGVLDSSGLGYAAAKQVNPRIIYVSVTGYGQTGPYAGLAGHDLNYIGYAGILEATGTVETGPVAPGAQLADVAGGAYMSVIGALSALHHRTRTGEGQHVDIAMLDGVLPLMTLELAHQWAIGDDAPGRGELMLSGGLACYSVYPASDQRYIALGALEPKFWLAFCQAVGRPEWGVRQFDQGEERAELKRALTELFQTRTREEWERWSRDKEICLSPVLSLDELAADPQLKARNMILQGADDLPAMGAPIRFGAFAGKAAPSAVPAWGEHGLTMLESMGYDGKKIKELTEKKIVHVPGINPST